MLTLAVPALPARLDPVTDAGPGPGLLTATCTPLIGLAPDGQLVQGLARGWRFDADVRALTLDLREGERFADGEPVDADAVAASLTRMVADRHSPRRAELAAVAAIEATGPLTVRLTLDRPYVPILAVLAGRAGMVTQDVGEDNDTPCAGPYRVEARRGEGMLELVRNGPPGDAGFARVRVVAVPDAALRLARVRAGAVDLAGPVEPADAAEAAREGRVRISAAADPGETVVLFNLARGARATGRVAREGGARAAFAASLDLPALAALAGHGYFAAIDAPATKATAGAPFELTVASQGADAALAAAIVRQASAAGIDVRLRVRDPARATLDVQNGDFEAALVRLPARLDPDMRLQPAFHCDGAANDGGYCEHATDALIERARAVADPRARADLYAQIRVRLADRLPAVFLLRGAHLVAAGPRAAGLTAYPDGGWRLVPGTR